jgi:hypothetical protein
MLTIPLRLPVKRMAMYGSTAMLIGFTGTLLMLREFAPKDFPTGVAVVETINKKPATSNTAVLDIKKADSQSDVSVGALPDQGQLVVQGRNVPLQQYSQASTPIPIYTAPNTPTATAPAPVASASQTATTGSGAPQPAGNTTATQPAAAEEPIILVPVTSGLQDTVSDVTKLNISTP